MINNKKEKWLNKILDNAISRRYNLKKYSIYYNSEELNVKCIKIKTIDQYKSMVEESSYVNEFEWYLISGINKISKSRVLSNKEYIFTNGKNMVEHVLTSNDNNVPNNFCNIFIAPKGTCSFFDIEIGQRLWIK